jgi:plasmid stabilization system protein ParE
MRLRWDPRAIQDLREIRSYIATRGSPKAADNVRRHLRARANRLCTHPSLGRPSSNSDIRILAATRYPYRIYYAIRDDAVVILHIRHTARQPPDDLSQ